MGNFFGGHICNAENRAFRKQLQIPCSGWARTEEWSRKNGYTFGKDETRSQVSWKYGVDFSLGPEFSPSDDSATEILSCINVNDIVPVDFDYEKGMTIAMVIFSVNGPPFEEEEIINDRIDRCKLPSTIGKGGAAVFTGEITHVGEKHIEYDINTYGSCSGGPVILLKSGREHHGKVIAVHAGHKIELNATFGFKVTSNVFTDF